MPTQSRSRTPSVSQKKGRNAEEGTGDSDKDKDKDMDKTPEPKDPKDPKDKSKSKQKDQKDQTESSEGQQKIDKHLKPVDKMSSDETQSKLDTKLDKTLKTFSDRLNKLASQEFIETKMKEMITQDFLTSKLKELQKEVKAQIKKEVEIVYKQVGELKIKVKSVEKTVEDLQNKVSDMETAVDNLEAESVEMKKEIKTLSQQLEEREIKLKVQAENINTLEQYTRKNSIRIYGVDDRKEKETADETARLVLKVLNDKLDIRLSTADIDITHRMGRFQADGNRPIICKFVSRFTKHEVIRARRKLKGTATVIREDLTLQNAKLLEKASGLDCVKSAWSDEGRVIALLKNKKKVVIDSKTDFDKLQETNPAPEPEPE